MSEKPFISLDSVLDESINRPLTIEELNEVRRIIYGTSAKPLDIPQSVLDLSKSENFTVKAYRFSAKSETFRDPRIVRIGLVQHKLPLPPSSPFQEQMEAVHARISQITKAASLGGVNIICFQVFFLLISDFFNDFFSYNHVHVFHGRQSKWDGGIYPPNFWVGEMLHTFVPPPKF